MYERSLIPHCMKRITGIWISIIYGRRTHNIIWKEGPSIFGRVDVRRYYLFRLLILILLLSTYRTIPSPSSIQWCTTPSRDNNYHQHLDWKEGSVREVDWLPDGQCVCWVDWFDQSWDMLRVYCRRLYHRFLRSGNHDFSVFHFFSSIAHDSCSFFFIRISWPYPSVDGRFLIDLRLDVVHHFALS